MIEWWLERPVSGRRRSILLRLNNFITGVSRFLFLHIPKAHAISPYGHQKTTIFGILLKSAYFACSAENFSVPVCLI
jgi:hypothetical protein